MCPYLGRKINYLDEIKLKTIFNFLFPFLQCAGGFILRWNAEPSAGWQAAGAAKYLLCSAGLIRARRGEEVAFISSCGRSQVSFTRLGGLTEVCDTSSMKYATTSWAALPSNVSANSCQQSGLLIYHHGLTPQRCANVVWKRATTAIFPFLFYFLRDRWIFYCATLLNHPPAGFV